MNAAGQLKETDETAQLPPEETAAAWPKERRLLWRLTREDGVPLQKIADATDYSRSMLSQFLHKPDFSPSAKFLTGLRSYFTALNIWDESALFEDNPGGYISTAAGLKTIVTETWKRVWYVLEATRDNKNFGMITGPSGCGKTEAIKFWLDKNAEDAIFITANGNMTRKSILRRIASSLGMFAPADADALIERICAELKTNPRLIIIDEADQICSEYKLETLRSLIDNGTAGIVLIGNEDLTERILRMAIDKRKLSRIHNRFGANQRVRMPREEEAAQWLKCVNLTPGARRRLITVLQRGNGMGGFRVAANILKTLFKAVGDGQITEEMLQSEELKNAVLSLNS